MLTLKELVEPERGIRYGIVQPGRFDHTGRFMIRGQDYSEAKGWAQPDEVFRVSDEIESRYKNARVKSGDLIITIVGYCGHVEVIPDWLDGANLTQTTARIAVDKKRASASFCRYMLQSPVGRMQVANNLKGAAQPGLNCGDVEKFLLPLPARRDEQSAIATALSDVDALLAAQDALIAKKRAVKQGAMQELLTGKRRLPGFGGEWEVERLGDVAHIKTGSRNNEHKVDDGDYPFFVRSEFVERIDGYAYDCEAILVPGEGKIGEVFHYITGRFDVHQRVYAITQFTAEVSGQFVHLFMKGSFGQWAMQNTVKATVDSLRLPTFQNFLLRLPPTKGEQVAIVKALSDMDAEITALETQRAKTVHLKQGMMQALLTGRIRLI